MAQEEAKANWHGIADATLITANAIAMISKAHEKTQANAPTHKTSALEDAFGVAKELLGHEPSVDVATGNTEATSSASGSSSSKSTAVIKRIPSQAFVSTMTINRPVVIRPSDLTAQRTETYYNPPESYSRMLDTYTDPERLEKALGKKLEEMVLIAAGTHLRCVFLVRFDGFDALENCKPYKTPTGKTFTWMPEVRLAPTFVDTFKWTLPMYVPGKTALIYLQAATDGREPDIYGRVMVVSARGCLPLYVNCPVCVTTTPSTKWCAGCRWVSYCGANHQKEHWKVHRHVCKLYDEWTGKKPEDHPQRNGQQLVPL
jgi:hypothetical protein